MNNIKYLNARKVILYDDNRKSSGIIFESMKDLYIYLISSEPYFKMSYSLFCTLVHADSGDYEHVNKYGKQGFSKYRIKLAEVN